MFAFIQFLRFVCNDVFHISIASSSTTPPLINIHYPSPIDPPSNKRFIPPEELHRQQISQMKQFYEDQRRRKYLREIQDLENRRHKDYFM